jgi:hypothetical protein
MEDVVVKSICVRVYRSFSSFFVKKEEDKRRFDEKLAACVKARGTKRDSLSTRVLSAK